MEIRVRAPQGQFLLERLLGGEEGLTIEIRGYELPTLDALAGRAAKLIKDVPGITDILTSLEAGIPQQEIHVNRDKVADLGLSVRDVTQLLQTAVAGSKAGDYRTGGKFLSHSGAAQGCRKTLLGRNSQSDADNRVR
jgi:hydrophobic/amphiphilic exporter-1 (mainly G- bacteria), HAE1 family